MKIGMAELLVVFIIALFLIGPDKLPGYIKKLSDMLKQFRDVSSEATKDIQKNVVEPLQEAEKPLREALEPVADLQKEINNDVGDIKKSFTDLGKPLKASGSGKSEESVSEAEDGKKAEAETDAGAAKETETEKAAEAETKAESEEMPEAEAKAESVEMPADGGGEAAAAAEKAAEA